MKKQILIMTVLLTGIFSETVFAASTEETARKFYSAIDEADAKTIQSIASSDFQFYNPFGPAMNAEGLTGFSSAVKSSFSGAQHQIRQVISTSNVATVIGTFTGKNTASFNGIPPTNKDVSVDFITVFEFDNAGKIKKMTAQNNSYSFMVQLGVATPPNPNSNIPAVMAVYENFGKGNIPGIIDAMDKNVVWDMRQNPFVNDARIYTGSQDVYNFFKSLQTSWAVLQFIPIDFSEVGNKVYVDGAFEYTLLKDNKNYHVNWTMIWEFKDGKPIHYVELFDTPQLIK